MSANFRSDNETPVAPQILEALTRANTGTAHSYGDDALTARVQQRFAEIFETEPAVYPLASGTAANALAVAQTTPPYGAVICHEDSHLNTDECGAPEFYSGGAKLLTLDGANGKIAAPTLKAQLENTGHAGDHASKRMLLSLTQATEFGTVYALEEVRELSDLAHAAGLKVHMDGARFANAVATLGCTPAEITWRAGVDLLSSVPQERCDDGRGAAGVRSCRRGGTGPAPQAVRTPDQQNALYLGAARCLSRG